MEHLNFSGSVSIDLSLHQSADYLVLHSNLLKVQNIFLLSDNVSVQPNKIQHASEHQQLILKFAKKLIPAKNYTLKMDYSGNLTDSLRGYYVSQFKNAVTGEKERLAITQFESTDARRAFPVSHSFRLIFSALMNQIKSLLLKSP
jgi:aminopeptidase N